MHSSSRKLTTAQKVAVPFRIHPRAFKALGADLVTNDVVAIIELVKNAYDAYATTVDIRFREIDGVEALEIEDNGSGMTRRVIGEAWCTVATPYRQENPVVTRPGKRNRRTSGAKGLGRLSAARLGAKLEMLTQTKNGVGWKVTVDWDQLARAESLDQCVATVVRDSSQHFRTSGTVLRILPLRSRWDEAAIDDLRENLGRLLPPFEVSKDFAIRLSRPDLLKEPVAVEPPEFLKHPKYLIRGTVDQDGTIRYEYAFHAVTGGARRKSSRTCGWDEVREAADDPILDSMERPSFGPFEFEIRAWDIGPQDTSEIAERFDLRKSSIRSDIRAYKGISVYRDGVLVLPKSEGARDWLGLDLRRVGRVGPRLSTPQVVGYVAITAAGNPDLEDTSDRERLATTPNVRAFEVTLRTIVSLMENERAKDRREAAKERRVVDLFQQLNASELVADVAGAAKEGKSAAEALPMVERFSEELDKAREEIETRFVYYSRLATVGTIAHMLVHEVRNRTTVLGSSLSALRRRLTDSPEDEALVKKAETAETALKALDTLANTFAPLANRQFRRRMRSSCLEESVLRCLLMLEGDLKEKNIKVDPPAEGVTEVAVDPGELDTILLNLFTNAVYWTGHRADGVRRIAVRSRRMPGAERVQVEVHDSGPGVPADDVERIFWPGVTNKPGGIGMGLTVASELVAEYGGRLGLDRRGALGGASFLFDLPLKSTTGSERK